MNIIHNIKSESINRYKSAISNKDLKREGSWNLQYPLEVKKLVEKIELKCATNGKTLYLKDYFLIRNNFCGNFDRFVFCYQYFKTSKI